MDHISTQDYIQILFRIISRPETDGFFGRLQLTVSSVWPHVKFQYKSDDSINAVSFRLLGTGNSSGNHINIYMNIYTWMEFQPRIHHVPFIRRVTWGSCIASRRPHMCPTFNLNSRCHPRILLRSTIRIYTNETWTKQEDWDKQIRK